MNNLAERKKELLARSEYYRESMAEEVHHLRAATAWVPRTIQVFRMVSPLLVVAAPAMGMLLKRRGFEKAAAPRKHMLGKILAGVQTFRKIKGFLDAFRPMRQP